MSRSLDGLLCAGVTFLAFYAGYAWYGRTEASTCIATAKCSSAYCFALNNPN